MYSVDTHLELIAIEKHPFLIASKLTKVAIFASTTSVTREFLILSFDYWSSLMFICNQLTLLLLNNKVINNAMYINLFIIYTCYYLVCILQIMLCIYSHNYSHCSYTMRYLQNITLMKLIVMVAQVGTTLDPKGVCQPKRQQISIQCVANVWSNRRWCFLHNHYYLP